MSCQKNVPFYHFPINLFPKVAVVLNPCIQKLQEYLSAEASPNVCFIFQKIIHIMKEQTCHALCFTSDYISKVSKMRHKKMEQYAEIKEMLKKKKMEQLEKRRKEEADKMKREQRGDYGGPKE